MSQPQTGNKALGQDKSRDTPAPPKEHGTWHKAAVLLVGGPDGHLIGDSSFVGGKLKKDTENSDFGVCFDIDYGRDPPAPKTSESLTIILKFREVMVDIPGGCGDLKYRTKPLPDGKLKDKIQPDKRTFVRFILRQPPVVEGFGLPFSDPARHEPGRKLEKFILGSFPGVKKSPEGTLLPVILHCPGQVIVQPETLSKSNPMQIKVTVKFIVELVQEMKIDPKGIVIINPYKWAADKGMPDAATVDSFHGREGVLTFFISISNLESGPGFVSDRNRLNVAETRQQSGLVIIGDKYVMGKKATVDKNETAKSIRIPGPDGEMQPINPGALLDTMRKMIELDRIADDRNPELSGLAEREADREAMGKGKGKE
ncbi:hypothetical protein KVR01_009191 [Diaporthe batatas]|uniref:uncharacterized protein n=1 Tax=Diaporthe batatas TaxID=748121 RepID=UPI001D04E701|nr:uncharacterized protein KVR01_009191 [Diaporthe batatas]KAG8160927.1 hypothetical protein KVR01_009191 [Diaporthe batatas]